MTSPYVDQPEQQRWQQPQFAPGAERPPVVTGQVLVPGEQVPPPSALESAVSTLTGLVWPVMILLAIFGPLHLVNAIIIAIIASAVLGSVKGRLRAQRRASVGPVPPPPQQQFSDLR